MRTGRKLQKELAMGIDQARREAVGSVPKSFPGSEKVVVQNVDRPHSGQCGVKNAK